jgi:hypothetical protein
VDEPENAKIIRSIGLDLQDIQDFRIDPSHDLIAFLFLPFAELAYPELHTMSSQQPHPLAAHPHLTFPSYSDPGMRDSFQIVDDIIGMCSLYSYYLVLVNWRTGTTIAVR